MDAKQAAARLTAIFSGHSVVFGVAHFRFLSVTVKLVDRGRAEVLVAHLGGQADDLPGIDPQCFFSGFPISYHFVG